MELDERICDLALEVLVADGKFDHEVVDGPELVEGSLCHRVPFLQWDSSLDLIPVVGPSPVWDELRAEPTEASDRAITSRIHPIR